MALGKYTKVDGRKSSSSYCSTVTLVAFVALCLVGVWMMSSSSVVPFQIVDTTTYGEKNDVKVIESDSKVINDSSNGNSASSEGRKTTKDSNFKQLEDNAGDLQDNATKGDSSSISSQQDRSNPVDDPKGNTQVRERSEGDTGGKQEEKPTPSQDASRTEFTKGKEIKEDHGSKTDDRDSKAGETRSDNEGRISGRQEENHVDRRGPTGGDNSDAEKKVKEKKNNEEKADGPLNEILPSAAQSEISNETLAQNGSFSTQETESKNTKEGHKPVEPESNSGYHWRFCNVTAGSDFIPCLDNLKAIMNLRSTKHYEHRERHCPPDPPTCLVSLPEGYQPPIQWPASREKIWYHNVPHTKLAEVKGHQNWVKVNGDYLTFPGGGTQFKRGAVHGTQYKRGAVHYIDFIQKIVPDIAWGKRSHVVLDVGCGVASFGGFLFDKDVLTMSLAPKDEHEAQVQFALERGIPALSAVMGTQRLPFPGRVFDVVHCARCRVPWHIEGGKLLLELNRLLRPGGFFVWSATPIYRKNPEDSQIWEAMKNLTKSMCWEAKAIGKEKVNRVAVAVYQKPTSNECYEGRLQNEPPLCKEFDDPNAAWEVPLQACMHKIPVTATERGSQWPEQWPSRLEKPPYWLLSSQVGVYGKAAPEDFILDHEHWKRVVTKSYMSGLGINWSTVRNVMDMRAVYGGFAAALKDMNVWVMNVVLVDSPDTLPIIYERGLFGIYHDWCESFSSYPRTYDLLHANHLFSKIKSKCNMMALVAEVDRLLRPEGKLIVRDNVETMTEVEKALRSMHWEVRLIYSKEKEGLLCLQKTMWRPKEPETLSYAIA